VKVGVLSPITWQLVEKMTALFRKASRLSGRWPTTATTGTTTGANVDEWEELGLQVSLNLAPFDSLEFGVYDVLIESVARSRTGRAASRAAFSSSASGVSNKPAE
jgi:hypothetical protein